MSEKQPIENQNQYKKVEYDNIKYVINEEENAAYVIRNDINHQHIFIPRSITQGTKEYNVTRICQYALSIKSIQFASDSKLETIDKKAFSSSDIKSITIPSSVTIIGEGAFFDCEQLERIEIPDDSKLQTIDNEAYRCRYHDSKLQSITIPSELVDLKEGWCFGTQNLTEIIVSPNNPRYCLYDEKFLLGKTTIKENKYENLIFYIRNNKHIKLPNFIKHICPYSFLEFKQLESIEIPNDSKLETIDKLSFVASAIKFIRIPSSVTSMCF